MLLTVVFFVLSVGIAVFAIAYRATLVQGEREEAPYAVPAPFVLQRGSRSSLVTVQESPPPRRFAATSVVRDSGFVSGSGGRDFTLARAACAGARAHRRLAFATSRRSRPPSSPRLLRPASTPRLLGIPLAGTHLTLPFTTTGDRVGLTAIVENRARRLHALDFGEHGPARTSSTVADPARGARRADRRAPAHVSRSPPSSRVTAKARRRSAVSNASTGTLRLGPQFGGWFGTNGIRVDGDVLRFVVNAPRTAIVRPHEPFEGEPVPIVASPAIARAAGPERHRARLHAENHVITARSSRQRATSRLSTATWSSRISRPG